MYQHKTLYIMDFTNINYYREIHEVIRESLDFPDYYGCNWSAFWDCLTDMVGRPINIEILGIDRIEKKFEPAAKKMTDILKDFKHYDNDRYADQINIAIVIENEKCYLP